MWRGNNRRIPTVELHEALIVDGELGPFWYVWVIGDAGVTAITLVGYFIDSYHSRNLMMLQI